MESKMEPFWEKSDFQEFEPRRDESIGFNDLRAVFFELFRYFCSTMVPKIKKS